MIGNLEQFKHDLKHLTLKECSEKYNVCVTTIKNYRRRFKISGIRKRTFMMDTIDGNIYTNPNDIEVVVYE